MQKHGKKYRALLEKLGDKERERSLEEAVALAVETSPTKFDGTIEIHLRTACDPKHADQIVRSTIVLPHGTGKSKKIAVFAEGTQAKEAEKAGADIVGGEELIDQVIQGKVTFEIALATPSMMKNMAKAAKILGPKGLMPSPKAGTVTEDIGKAVEEIKKGKIEFKTDKQGIIHSVLGKVSFGKEKILENATSLLKAIKQAKPSGIKGSYIESVTLATTMGPGIKVEVASAMAY